jgi:hypothetical protein
MTPTTGLSQRQRASRRNRQLSRSMSGRRRPRDRQVHRTWTDILAESLPQPPQGLRLHQLPGPARRHLPRLRPAPPAHPHRAAPPARPLRPHRPAPAATAPARRHHLLLHQRPRRHPSCRAASRRARAGRPAARRRPHLRAARLTRAASRNRHSAAAAGRHLRGRPRGRLRRQRPGWPPARSRRGPGRARRPAMRPRTAGTSRDAARWTATAGSSRPWRLSAPPSPTSCCTAGPTILIRKSPPGSPPTGPSAAASPDRETCSPTGTGPAPPSKPRWPGHSHPGWTPSASSVTAPSAARPASPAPIRPATWPRSSRR